jgi:GNAT superfamily N-acetyltransferase
MGATIPAVTPTLAAQLEASITFFSAEKQRMLSLFPDNPYGVYVRSFGKATAFLAQRTNSTPSNRVHHISGDDLPYLSAILDWYRNYDALCSFEVVPLLSSPLLLWHLAKRGFYQSGFYNVLYGLPTVDAATFPHITIRAVQPEEKELFADVYFNSFGVPMTTAYNHVRDSIRVLVDIPSNQCFFALIEKRIAAIAVLSLSQQIGYLALAATLPSFRGYGCHKALLQARIEKAASQGCQIVTGQAGVGTVSQQNMERFGLRLAYTKTDWTIYSEQQPDSSFDPFNQ